MRRRGGAQCCVAMPFKVRQGTHTTPSSLSVGARGALPQRWQLTIAPSQYQKTQEDSEGVKVSICSPSFLGSRKTRKRPRKSSSSRVVLSLISVSDRKTHNHKQVWGNHPGLAWVPKTCYVFTGCDFLGGSV